MVMKCHTCSWLSKHSAKECGQWHKYSQTSNLGKQGQAYENSIHTWGQLDGLENLHSGLVRGPLCFSEGPCLALNDMSLQHFDLIQSLLMELPNLPSG